MHETGVEARQLLAQLTDGLKERQAFDVAHRAADLHQDEVDFLAVLVEGRLQDEVLDLVGDVGDHLHGGAQIVPSPLLLQNGLVDAAGGDVVALGGRHAGEALVVAKVQVGLRPVVGDENLAVLVGAHRPRIDVEIGVELPKPNLVSAGLQQCAKGGGSEAFSQRGNHAAGNENIAGHGGSD